MEKVLFFITSHHNYTYESTKLYSIRTGIYPQSVKRTLSH